MPADEENLDSAAKLMQEVLKKASSELERKVSILTGKLVAFNKGMDRLFQDEAKAAYMRLEVCLRQNSDALSQDKEELKKLLNQYQETEITKLLQASRQGRQELAGQVSHALSKLGQVAERTKSTLEEMVLAPEANIESRLFRLRDSLERAVQESQTTLSTIEQRESERIKTAGNDLADKLENELGAFKHYFEDNRQQFEAKVKEKSDSTIFSVQAEKEKQETNLKRALDSCLQSIQEKEAAARAKMQSLLNSQTEDASRFLTAFENKGKSDGQMVLEVLQAELTNFTAASRSQVLTESWQSQQRLSLIKAELAVKLRESYRECAEGIETLYNKLEAEIDKECKSDWDEGFSRKLKEERSKDHLQGLFRRNGSKVLENVAAAAAQIEADFQRYAEACEHKVETIKSHACESLERETKLMKKELERNELDFEKQVVDLEMQISRIEKVGLDAAHIVKTIKKANLKF
ncbi:MAG: hypothetical protein K2W82_10360 [Candidatus Obscuribacterales bacterium]|nr:hypothetical protein [Candidatus Obscuribacterales bacterium]